jgi:tetratricopeptide (TPR) repeat protein
VQPGLQRRHDLDTGLEHPFAENVLRAMDADRKLGLWDAPDALLAEAQERTRGYPRALEHLFGILSADRDTSLREILDSTRQFLPEKVMEVLVGEAFSRLDLTAQRVMQALATYRYPVPSAAVDYLLLPYVPGVDSGRVLSRFVNMQFVHRDAGRYYLHQVDRDYALGQIPEGQPADRAAEAAPPLSRFALQHRAAEWFKLSRTPRETWRTLADLAAPLSEFELRCAGEDYDTAAAVLLDIDCDYLLLWGHHRLTAELHERLQGKITDPALRKSSVGNLGSAYYRIGHYQRAITCYEQALRLAREHNDRWGEGVWLGNLGNCYANLDQTDQAIDYYAQALAIAREVGDRHGEAAELCKLGNRYADIGQTARAIEYYQQALAIDREIGDRPGEAVNLCNLGERYSDLGQTAEALHTLKGALTIARETGFRLAEAAAQANMGNVYLAQGEWGEATRQFKQALEIADDTANTQFQKAASLCLACAILYQGEIAAAREMAEAARQYDVPLSNHKTWAVLGVVALRQGDCSAAQEAFATALQQAGKLLTRSPQLYDALDTRGLALCGLALCESSVHVPAAQEAYRAARVITSDAGIVGSVLQLFDALAKADPHGILAEVRAAAAGENPE